MKRLFVAALLAAVLVPAASARMQGAKGRRLQVLADLMPYRDGVVILEEPRVVTNMEARVVRVAGIRLYAQQFLETRLRELPWTVRAWYQEFGPVAAAESDKPALVLDCTVFFEKGKADDRVMMEIFARDLVTGRVVARYQGYGRTAVRSIWPGVRDNFQEISRVFVAELAEELQVAPPPVRGYESDPYRRRDVGDVEYRMLTIDKNHDLPTAEHHADPPVNDVPRGD